MEKNVFIGERSEAPRSQSKRVYYTEELKLQLIRLWKLLETGSEVSFWQYITALFKDITGHQVADLRKKVSSMVGDRKGRHALHKELSGVVCNI